jgi:hypothetical protein
LLGLQFHKIQKVVCILSHEADGLWADDGIRTHGVVVGSGGELLPHLGKRGGPVIT